MKIFSTYSTKYT